MNSSLIKKIVISCALVIVGAATSYFAIGLMRDLGDPFKDVEEVGWQLLAQFDYQAGFVPEVLKQVTEGREVKIAGFVVPLTDDFKEIREFLLVPDSMSCIHVPPPPTNQMVLVTLEKPMNSQLAYGPVWVKGHLIIKSMQNTFGVAGYQMRATHVRVYEDQPWK